MLLKLTRASFKFGARFLTQEQFVIKSRFLSSALAVPSSSMKFSNQKSLVCCNNYLISIPFTRLMSNSLTDEKVKLKQEQPENFTRDDNMLKLPGHPILTTMMTTSGAKIHLVGTIHCCKKSKEIVSNVIRQTQPNVVFVELCDELLKNTFLYEKTTLSGLTWIKMVSKLLNICFHKKVYLHIFLPISVGIFKERRT